MLNCESTPVPGMCSLKGDPTLLELYLQEPHQVVMVGLHIQGSAEVKGEKCPYEIHQSPGDRPTFTRKSIPPPGPSASHCPK